jgi:hypothetical protein
MDRKVVGALALALALASCGSSTLSRADLVKQANAICRHQQSLLNSEQKRAGRNFRAFVSGALPIVERRFEELKKLTPSSSSLKASYARFVGYERVNLAQVREIVAAQRTGRRPSVIQHNEEGHKRAALVESLHLSECR